MNSKLLTRGLFAIAIMMGSLRGFAQDSTEHAAPKPTASKPKPTVTTTQAAGKPANPAAKPATVPKVATPAPTLSTGAANPTVQTTPVEPASPNDRSLNGQYQYLYYHMSAYQKTLFSAFYKSVSDSLNASRKQIKPLTANVKQLDDSVKALHKQLDNQTQTLSESTGRVDSINFLGMSLSKTAYNGLMWGLVAVFGIVAVVVIVRSGGYSREAGYRTRLYEELDEEYKTFKAKANEKEKKLARELQTARNKLEEITGKPEY